VIVGITRVRNEALILADTLAHYLARVDHVLLYDDASTDATAEIAASFDRVTVTRGTEWRQDRPAEETRHRALLLDAARQSGATWCLCFDADERIEGELPDLSGDGYRFRLFDGYMTDELQAPYAGGELADLPRMWGPEYRDILMLFRVASSRFLGRDSREPRVRGRVALADVRVKHYGKCLSVEHWEETCRYYAGHWPEPYRSKWRARAGRAIHVASDFNLPLYRWQDVAANGVPL
jgi:glycosyltransferase involved in cell wall biosynthesis